MLRHIPALLAFLAAAPAAACPVCFGKTSDTAGVAAGLNWALAILLSFTFAILASLTYAVVQIERMREAEETKGLKAKG